MKKLLSIAAIGLTAMAISACTPEVGGSDYSVQGVGSVSNTAKGTIVSVRAVKIHARDRSKPGVGAVAGGLGGAAIGSQFGGGRGRYLTTAAGAIGGALAGHAIEQKVTEQTGYEYQVKLDKGGTISITQGAPRMGAGQRVTVIYGGRGRSRIVAG